MVKIKYIYGKTCMYGYGKTKAQQFPGRYIEM